MLSFFQYVAYDKVASGLGAVGLQLDRSNVANLRSELEKAVKENKAGKSVVINVLIGRTNFREGSISV